MIARAILEAVELESISWTVSDYPNTVGGRLAPLNVGVFEVLYVPRRTCQLKRVGGTSADVHLKLSASAITLRPLRFRAGIQVVIFVPPTNF